MKNFAPAVFSFLVQDYRTYIFDLDNMASSDLKDQMKAIAETNFPHWFTHLKIIKKIQSIGAKRVKMIRAMKKKSGLSEKEKVSLPRRLVSSHTS